MLSIYSDIKKTNLIAIPYGCTYSDVITITGTNLTGYIIESQLRGLDGVLVATFSIANTSLATGVFTRTLTPIQTALLVPSLVPAYVWGIKLTKPDGSILPEIQGGATVNAGIVI